jgi:hypothetical protein
MGILVALLGLANLILAIIVLIKLFQTEGALKGILGLICGIYTFIWGWMNANKLGIRNIMLAWTAVIILYFIVSLAFGVSVVPRGMPTTTTP